MIRHNTFTLGLTTLHIWTKKKKKLSYQKAYLFIIFKILGNPFIYTCSKYQVTAESIETDIESI